MHLGRFFCTPFPCGPCAPSAPRECAGLRPSPPLRGSRCAPRRGARSAQRARNERATSEERASIGVAGRPFGPRSGRAVRSVGVRRSVGRFAPLGPARPSAPPAGVGPFARVRTAAGGRSLARASAPPRRGRGRGAPSPLLAGEGGAPPLIPARGGPRRSARRVRPLSCADVGGGAPSGLPCRPAPALGLFRAAPPVLPPRARRARVKGLRTPPLGLRAASALPRPHPPALIQPLDTTAALKVPGVAAV